MTDQIHIYTELLSNIRAISLVITLQSTSNQETKASISADGSAISVSHDGYSAGIALPTEMQGGGSATLELPAIPSKELTLRMQLQEKEPGLLKLEENESGNAVPWSANEMANSQVMCGQCSSVIVERNEIQAWRDLPSDDWAEMMDLWHCHKPHDDDNETNHPAKGYSASNQLIVSPGVGFISQSHFLLSYTNCHNIKMNETTSSISCSACAISLGVEDHISGGIKLSKWRVCVDGSSYAVEKWFTAQLLSAIENEGIRRFVLREESKDDNDEGLSIWVFADDVYFSSSVLRDSRNDPTRAMKILWRKIPAGDTRASLNQEDVYLPSDIFTGITKRLVDSTKVLPTGLQTFQNWQVSLLSRFSSQDFSS